MPHYTTGITKCCLFGNEMVERLVLASVETCIKNDMYLIKNDLHEGALSHRIAIYLDELFPEYNVDAEWNKNLSDEKTIFTRDLIRNITEIIEEWSRQKNKDVEDEALQSRLSKVRDLLSVGNRSVQYNVMVTDFSGDEMLTFPEPDDNGRYIVKSIRPDIVIHHRGTRQNIAVIEVKKKNASGQVSRYSTSKDFDLIKLYALTTQPHLQYQIGIYIELPESKDTHWKRITVSDSPFLKELFGKHADNVLEITFN